MRFLIALAFFASPACAEPEPIPIASIYWSDGDSGRLTLESGEVIKFRLKDVDAPETGGIGSIGGAKCEAERVLGFEAKAFMVDLSRQPLAVSRWFGPDRFGRELISLLLAPQASSDREPASDLQQPSFPETKDLAQLAIQAGHLRPWDYDRGEKKPNWCG